MHWLALLHILTGSAAAMATSEPPRAITMDVAEAADRVTVVLKGHSAFDQQVSYELVLEGQSTSRHEGRTRLAAGETSVLSTMRMSADGPWCVRAKITEADGTSYEYSEGVCD